MSNVVAIIPARGGSKGIKRKNLVPLAGKPLVAHSVQHALDAKLVDRVIVSTEDAEIAEAARAAGAEVPFLRPDELAGDLVLDWPVFEHALRWLEAHGDKPEVVVHLRPTAPYRKAGWIDEAVELLRANPNADSVRSVSKVDQHPWRVFKIGDDGVLDPLMKAEHPQPYLLRRQDLPPLYYYNCVIDVTRRSTILDKQSMTGDRMLAYVMNANDVLDIDTPRDLAFARFVLEGGGRS
ncbi:MAG TPA: acylneuraminate cytidylyltransferase family protein [Kofleriaceae bacterium]|nr:acylneuraminate cytidylyltransferase family protein [Kofleriaceae bacterium]